MCGSMSDAVTTTHTFTSDQETYEFTQTQSGSDSHYLYVWGTEGGDSVDLTISDLTSSDTSVDATIKLTTYVGSTNAYTEHGTVSESDTEDKVIQLNADSTEVAVFEISSGASSTVTMTIYYGPVPSSGLTTT